MTFLNISNINKVGLGNFKLENISFLQSKNQKVALAGETGSGKSTLLKIIAGLEQPDDGEVLFREERVHGPVETLVPGHPSIAYLSQEFELPKFLRVDQILSYANKLSEENASSLFEVCEISHLMERKTNELSGGEKQRIALAKLLIGSPQLLLLDEPFSNLDIIHKTTLKKVLNSICDELKITCILVSHDPLDTLSWADKILVMKDGKIVQQGSPKKIYSKPLNEYIAGLFGSYNVLTGEQSLILGRTLGIKTKNSKSIIRPENIKLTAKKKNSIEGKVKKIKYFGGYHELNISVESMSAKIHIRLKKVEVRRGELVHLRYSTHDLWPIR